MRCCVIIGHLYSSNPTARIDGRCRWGPKISVLEGREAEYEAYYGDNVVGKFDSGGGSGGIVDETGVTRNVKGEGPFHDMSVRCLYHWRLVEGTRHSNGSCVHTDKDGD